MGKTINTILNLTDKFTPKLSEAGKKTLIFKEQLRNCNAATQKIDKGLSQMAKAAAAASAAGVAAMGAFAASSVKAYGDFQKSMSNVAGIMSIDSTSENYKMLESAAREAGKSTTKTAQESADALSYMALAGWNVADSISGLNPVLKASEATGADLATTSDLITDSMSALGLKTNELQGYLDVCARAQNKSNTTLTQMQEAYIGVGGTFKTFGTSLQESGALLGVLANRGIKGSEAGNSLQSTLVNLTKKSGESAEAMKAIGVSAYDSNGKFKGVTNVLKEVQKATSKMTEEQRNNYLTMIAGKTQLTTLNALMSGLSNTLDNGSNEFKSLYDTLGNCDGALDKMADTMTNNYAGAMARAGSAMDDFKITIGQKLEPYVTKFLNWFSEKLPNATEKFAVYLDNKIPKAINFCKKAFEKIKPVVSFVITNFSELASVGVGVVAGLKVFSIITKVVSLMNKLKTATTLMKVAQIALNTSMLACPLTWVAVGIGAVVGGILMWKSHMEKADIAKRFGDIMLSAEECSGIVRNVFGSAVLDRVEAADEATKQFEQSLNSTKESARELNKLNFQIKLDSDISQEDYTKAVDEHIKNLQNVIKDKRYSLKLSTELLFDNTRFGAMFSTDTNGYYGKLSTQAEKLGESLKNAVKAAYENNWDLNSTDAVMAIMKQQAEIQEKISTAQSEAKLETLKYDFVTGDLSKESFQNLINAGSEEIDALKETYNKARIDAIAQAKLNYGDDSGQYELALKNANEAYNSKMADLSAKGIQFQSDAIRGAFPEVDEALKNAPVTLFQMYDEEAFNDIAKGDIELADNIVEIITRELGNSFDEVSPEVRKQIGEYYKEMLPTTEEFLKNMKGMEKIPQSYAEIFAQSSAIGAVGDNASALKNLGVSALSLALPSETSKILKNSKKYGEIYAEGLASDENKKAAKTAGENLREVFTDTLSKSIDIVVPVNISTANSQLKDSAVTGKSNSWLSGVDSLKGHATGTTYFGGGLTQVNENGGEIINLPTGAQIIPADKSEKLVNGKNDINVSVNIQGNIFGLENAAEIIGDMVCGKIFDSIQMT